MPDPIPALTAALLAYAWADILDDLGLAVLLPAAVLVVGGVNVVMGIVYQLVMHRISVRAKRETLAQWRREHGGEETPTL